MKEIVVGRQKTAYSQARLHVIAAVARAVLEDRRHREHRPYGNAPQYVPAALGELTPARSRGDTSGSEMVARLDAAKIAAELTGADRDLERVFSWERKLKGLDMPAPETARHLNEAEDAKQVAERLWRQARGDAREALGNTERYLDWVEKQIESGIMTQLREAVRTARRDLVPWLELKPRVLAQLPAVRGARALAKIRSEDYLKLWDTGRELREARQQALDDLKAGTGSEERAAQALERLRQWKQENGPELTRLRQRVRGAYAAQDMIPRLIPQKQLRMEIKTRTEALDLANHALQNHMYLERDHANRERILASARARVAASKTRKAKHQPIKRLPDPVYAITIPALTITAPGLTITLPFQRLQLDLRAANRTEAQTEALRVVLSQEAQPVRWNKGRHERADGIAPEVWGAWEALTDGMSVAQHSCVQPLGDTQLDCAVA